MHKHEHIFMMWNATDYINGKLNLSWLMKRQKNKTLKNIEQKSQLKHTHLCKNDWFGKYIKIFINKISH